MVLITCQLFPLAYLIFHLCFSPNPPEFQIVSQNRLAVTQNFIIPYTMRYNRFLLTYEIKRFKLACLSVHAMMIHVFPVLTYRLKLLRCFHEILYTDMVVLKNQWFNRTTSSTIPHITHYSEKLKLKQMRHYYMYTWSKKLSLPIFQ